MRRRDFFALALSGTAGASPIVVKLNVLYDHGAHSGKGLTGAEVGLFQSHQEKARREFAVSGVLFDLHFTEGAYLREQGHSVIPEKFLLRDRINLFVTETLHYDVDRHRTGGVSIGAHAGDPYFKTFLGLREAGAGTLAHEYAHHFTLDTSGTVKGMGNLWADFRNDYWLWRQRIGVAIEGFRACGQAAWVKR